MVGIRSLLGLLLDGLEGGGLLLPGDLLLVGPEPLHLVVAAPAPGSVGSSAPLRLLPGLLGFPACVRIVGVILLPLPLVGLHHPLPFHGVGGADWKWLRDNLPSSHLVFKVRGGDLGSLDGHHAVVIIIGIVTVILSTVTGVSTTCNVSGES